MLTIPNTGYLKEQIALTLICTFCFLLFVVTSRYGINHLHSSADRAFTTAAEELRSLHIQLDITQAIKKGRKHTIRTCREQIDEDRARFQKRTKPDDAHYKKGMKSLEEAEKGFENLLAMLKTLETLEHEQMMAWTQAVCQFHDTLGWVGATETLNGMSLFEICCGGFLLAGKSDGKSTRGDAYQKYLLRV